MIYENQRTVNEDNERGHQIKNGLPTYLLPGVASYIPRPFWTPFDAIPYSRVDKVITQQYGHFCDSHGQKNSTSVNKRA